MRLKARKFNGFGVVTRQGCFLWQYSRVKEDETRQAYENHNPQVEGHPDGYKLVRVHLKIEAIEE